MVPFSRTCSNRVSTCLRSAPVAAHTPSTSSARNERTSLTGVDFSQISWRTGAQPRAFGDGRQVGQVGRIVVLGKHLDPDDAAHQLVERLDPVLAPPPPRPARLEQLGDQLFPVRRGRGQVRHELVVELGLLRVEFRLLGLEFDEPGAQRGETLVVDIDTADRFGEFTVELPVPLEPLLPDVDQFLEFGDADHGLEEGLLRTPLRLHL